MRHAPFDCNMTAARAEPWPTDYLRPSRSTCPNRCSKPRHPVRLRPGCLLSCKKKYANTCQNDLAEDMNQCATRTSKVTANHPTEEARPTKSPPKPATPDSGSNLIHNPVALSSRRCYDPHWGGGPGKSMDSLPRLLHIFSRR